MLSKILALIFSLALINCSTTDEKDSNTARGAYDLAEKYKKSERYEESLSYFNEVKNKFPYSPYAIKAELNIAEIQYRRENFVEAQSSYQLFKEFHPDYKNIDYISFQIGMSLFKQLPSAIDRDLSMAGKAIEAFQEVLQKYKKSDYFGSAKDHLKLVQRILAKKELYIANFYFREKAYKSASGRYKNIIDKYPNVGFNKIALFKGSISAFRDNNKTLARQFYLELEKTFPQSQETQQAKRELINGK